MTEKELERLVNSFPHFLAYTWAFLNLPKPTRMQLEVAKFLQEKGTRKVLQTLRGLGKTWTTGAYVAWRLLREPNEKILIVSQSGGHADNIALFINKLIYGMDILAHLKPDAAKRHRTSAVSFDVNGCEITVQPSVKSLGITSQLQGNRATLLIADDIEGQANSATELMRAKLNAASAEFEAILQTGESASILVLGTPQSHESIYNNMREAGYVTRIFPARLPEKIEQYYGCLAPYIEEMWYSEPNKRGHPLDERFTEEELNRREARYGLSGFKLQFMLDTSLSDEEKFPLKQRDLIVYPCEPREAPLKLTRSLDRSQLITNINNLGFTGDPLYRGIATPERVKYELSVIALDPSGSGKDGFGYCVASLSGGRVYVLEAGSLSGGYEDKNLVKIATIAKTYGCNYAIIERNFGDGMFTQIIAPVFKSIHPMMIEEVRAKGQKEIRIIDSIEPLLSQHRIVFNEDMIKRDVDKALQDVSNLSYSLMYQLTHLNRARGALKHDDTIEAVAIALEYYKPMLLQTVDEAVRMYEAKQMDEWLEKIASNPISMLRYGTSKPNVYHQRV